MLETRNLDFKIWTKIVWERVEENDPRRCQAVTKMGQCCNKAVDGSNYCYAHGGNKGIEKQKKKRMDNFRLNQAKYRARAEELQSSSKIASLKDEVAILRILIEERMNRCQNQQELLLSSGPLSDLIMKSAALVEKCHKIDMKLNNLLDRGVVIQFAQVIIEIISKHADPDILESISSEINVALENL